MADTIYAIDTNVISAIADGEPIVISDIVRVRALGVRIAVPNQVMIEARQTGDAGKRGLILALIRDLGFEVQPPTTGVAPKAMLREDYIKEYFRFYPKQKNLSVGPNIIQDWIQQNPQIIQKVMSKGSMASKEDQLVLRDVQLLMERFPNDNIRFYTVEKIAGKEPTNISGQRWKMFEEFGIIFADESRKLRLENSASIRKYGKLLAHGQQIYEIMPELQNKMITVDDFEIDGALSRAVRPPPLPSTPPGALKFAGLLGTGFRLVAGWLLEVAITVAISAGVSFLQDYLQKELLRGEMENEVAPQIKSFIGLKRFSILTLIRDAKQPFLKFTLKYYAQDRSVGDEHGVQYPTNVKLDDISGITDQEMASPSAVPFSHEDISGGPGGGFFSITYSGSRVTMTAAVTFSREEIDLFNAYMDVIEYCNDEALDARRFRAADLTIPQSAEAFWANKKQTLVDKLNTIIHNAPPPSVI